MIKRLVFSCLVMAFGTSLVAQEIEIKPIEEIFAIDKVDSSVSLDLETFMLMVLNNHPVAKQANLLPEQARQQIRMARGAFDPKLGSSWDVKNFDDKEYYDFFNTTLKVPTWFPLDPKISVDRNRGVFVNQENFIPRDDDFRQVTAGLSLPVGKGLLIDKRRAAVMQAQLLANINDAEQIKVINKLLLEASKEYWNWYYAYYNFRLVEFSLGISEDIYSFVLQDFEFGEVAAIDTVQAAITLQNRQIDRQTALIDFQNAGLMLSNFLWGENEEPLELAEYHLPAYDDLFDLMEEGQPNLDTLLIASLERHPELQKLNFKLDQLQVDLRLAKENLKPQLDLNYNVLNAPINSNGEWTEVRLRNNYEFGIDFSIPLFLRKERAKVSLSKIRIDRTMYEQELKEREVLNGIQSAYFSLDNSKRMLGVMSQSVANYKLLLEAELFNLELGESDFFKINFQQDKLLEAQVKLIKLKAEVEKAKVLLYWSAGFPYLNFEPRP